MSEALEKECRKLNSIIFNIPVPTDINSTNSSDPNTVKTLFQSLLNAFSPLLSAIDLAKIFDNESTGREISL